MNRSSQVWSVIPVGAKALALVFYVVMMVSLAVLLLSQRTHMPAAIGALLATVVPIGMSVFILLLGYVWGDAKRRGMRYVLWTLLALFIPNVIGVILYFILRDPLLVSCTSCGAQGRKGYAFCPKCGATLKPPCPHCRQPIEQGWTHCAHCGAALSAGSTPATA